MPQQKSQRIQAGRLAAITLALKLTSTGSAFAVGVLFARTLGPQEFGAYATVMALLNLLAVLGAAGLPGLLVRELSSYEARADWGRLSGLIRSSMVISIAAALVAGIGAVAALVAFGDEHVRKLAQIDWIVILSLCIALSLNAVRSGTLRGLNRVLLAQIPDLCVAPVVVALTLAAAAYLPSGSLSASRALSITFSANLAAFALGMIFLFRSYPRTAHGTPPKFEITRWLKMSGPFLLLGAGQLLNGRIDTLMIGVMLGSSSAGIYQVASRGADLIAMGYLAFAVVAGPRISASNAGGDRGAVQTILRKGGVWIAATSIVTGAVLIGAGPLLLRVIFGEGYETAYVPLAVLSGARILFAAFGLCDITLQMLGSAGFVARTLVGVTVANVFMNLLLIPILGTLGAALATGAALVSWNALLARHLRGQYNLRSSVLQVLG